MTSSGSTMTSLGVTMTSSGSTMTSLDRAIKSLDRARQLTRLYAFVPLCRYYSLLTPLNLPPEVFTSINFPSGPRFTNKPVFGFLTWVRSRTAPIRCPSPTFPFFAIFQLYLAIRPFDTKASEVLPKE